MNDQYICVMDDLNGTIFVYDQNDQIDERFDYGPDARDTRSRARLKAEDRAVKLAKQYECDWGTNY